MSNMLKTLLTQYSLILLMSFANLTQAYAETPDPLQVYRDEIKRSEALASQAILDTLDPTESDNTAYQQHQTSPEAFSAAQKSDSDRSNTEKAFTPTNTISAPVTNHSSKKNPWLQPNPWAKNSPTIWEKKAKINPYANAPVPGPTSSKRKTVPSPPNIFLPSQPNHTNNPEPNANS